MNLHDFKNLHESNRPLHPSLAECMAWGLGCAVIWVAVFALAAYKLGAI